MRLAVKGVRIVLALLLALLSAGPALALETAGYRDIMVSFTASDGTPLEGKLSVPTAAAGPVPVVFYLHGAGPGTYDTPRATRNANGEIVRFNYYDSFAREMVARGMAFFRVSKRGVTIDPATGREVVERAVFSKATRSVLLDDYVHALAALRARPEIDPSRIVLGGVSEGTVMAARLALASPQGVAGVVLDSYNGDNNHDTVLWQTTLGPWRNIQQLFPGARDGVLTRAEYEAVVAQVPPLGRAVQFDRIDANADGSMVESEMVASNKPASDALLAAAVEHNDDLIWRAQLNLTSAYLLEEWDTPPTSATLLRLTIPIGIFHGELDGTCRVEAVRETEAAFHAAGKTNLTVHIYPGLNHDLGWTPQAAEAGGPQPYRDSFDFAASLVRAGAR